MVYKICDCICYVRHKLLEKKKFIKRASAEAVEILLDQAEQAFASHPQRSRRYVQMAFALIKKNRIRLPREMRLRFCKKCLRYWMPDKTVTITFEPRRNGMLFTCACGAKRRVILE